MSYRPRLTNRHAATGPVFHDSETTELAIRTTLRRRQDTAVGTGEDNAGRYVTVRVGRVLVYTYGEDTTAVHVAGWRQADTLARRSFPAGYQAEPADLRDANTASVGYAGLHVAGTPDLKVRGGARPAVPVPFVQVQVGQLVCVALDAAAVASTLAAWAKAARLAENWFNPDPHNLSPADIAAFQRGWRPSRSG